MSTAQSASAKLLDIQAEAVRSALEEKARKIGGKATERCKYRDQRGEEAYEEHKARVKQYAEDHANELKAKRNTDAYRARYRERYRRRREAEGHTVRTNRPVGSPKRVRKKVEPKQRGKAGCAHLKGDIKSAVDGPTSTGTTSGANNTA